MKSERYIKISCIVLLLIVIIQFILLFINGHVGYIFNINNKIEKLDDNNIKVEIISNILKENLDSDDRVALLMNDLNNPYTSPLANEFYRYDLYPIEVINIILYSTDLKRFTDYDEIIRRLNIVGVNKVIVLGKDAKLLDTYTSSDVTIFDYNDNSFTKNFETNYQLTDLFDIAKDKDFVLSKIDLYMDQISYYWSFKSIDALKELLSLPITETNYNYFYKYLQFYFDNVDALNPDINYNIGLYYYYNGNYDLAKTYYDRCLNIDDCDIDLTKEALAKLQEVK